MNDMENYDNETFESIKHIDKNEWRKFENVKGLYNKIKDEKEYVSGEWDGTVNTPVLVDGLIPITYDTEGNPVEVNSTDEIGMIMKNI